MHCCRENPYFEGDAYLKFPFDVQKRSYSWWDNTLGATVALHYAGTKKVQGYTGYRFTGTVAPTKIGTRLVPGTIVGRKNTPQVLAEEWYSNHGIELVADQRTGRVIYAQIGPRRTLRAPGTKKDAVVLLDSREDRVHHRDPEGPGETGRRQEQRPTAHAWGRRCRSAPPWPDSFWRWWVGVLVLRGRRRPESARYAVEHPRLTSRSDDDVSSNKAGNCHPVSSRGERGAKTVQPHPSTARPHPPPMKQLKSPHSKSGKTPLSSAP